MKKSRGEVATTRTVETGAGTLLTDNMGIPQGDPKDDIGVAIGTSTPNHKPPATPSNEEPGDVRPVTSRSGSTGRTASPVLPSYHVGRKISLPFGHFLPRCVMCDCCALIVRTRGSNSKHKGFLCLDHGLSETSVTRDLDLRSGVKNRYAFISPEHKAAIRALFA